MSEDKQKRVYCKYPDVPTKKMDINFTYMVEYLEDNLENADKWLVRIKEVLAANDNSKPPVAAQNTVLKEWIAETFPNLVKQKKEKKVKQPTLMERLEAAAAKAAAAKAE